MSRLKRLLLRLRGPLLPVDAVGSSKRLTDCPACRSHFVIPADSHERDESSWWVLLRCGECAWSREAIITDAEAKRFERDLERGLGEIARTVAKLDLERMQWEADIFVAALTRDLIGPGDFSSHSRP
jgi:hypothetical protein